MAGNGRQTSRVSMPTISYELVPLYDYKRGEMNTVSGTILNLKHPEPAMITIYDIAIGLSRQVRWAGQTYHPINVAQHSVLVCALAPKAHKAAALLHDAAEAYLGDVCKPVKHLIGKKFARLEDRLLRAVFERFSLPYGQLELIKPYDLKVMELEHQALYKGNWNNLNALQMEAGLPVGLWSEETAQIEFTKAYERWVLNKR